MSGGYCGRKWQDDSNTVKHPWHICWEKPGPHTHVCMFSNCGATL